VATITKQERLTKEPPQPEVERAREACLRLLSYRARSRRELAERLERKGFDDGVIHAAVGELEAAGLVDDEEFARSWVRERLANNPRGSRGMRWELRSKGVKEEVIQRTLEQEVSAERELEAALRVAATYVTRSSEDEPARLRRLAGALRRRGFAFEVIETVLARVRQGDGFA